MPGSGGEGSYGARERESEEGLPGKSARALGF